MAGAFAGICAASTGSQRALAIVMRMSQANKADQCPSNDWLFAAAQHSTALAAHAMLGLGVLRKMGQKALL